MVLSPSSATWPEFTVRRWLRWSTAKRYLSLSVLNNRPKLLFLGQQWSTSLRGLVFRAVGWFTISRECSTPEIWSILRFKRVGCIMCLETGSWKWRLSVQATQRSTMWQRTKLLKVVLLRETSSSYPVLPLGFLSITTRQHCLVWKINLSQLCRNIKFAKISWVLSRWRETISQLHMAMKGFAFIPLIQLTKHLKFSMSWTRIVRE